MTEDVRARGERRVQPPTISVSMFEGAPLLGMSAAYTPEPTPELLIAHEILRLAGEIPWFEDACRAPVSGTDESAGSGRAAEAARAVPSRRGLRSPAAVLLEAHRPGPELARKLERTSLADADDATLVEIVAAWEREAARAAAQQARAVAELGRRRAAGGPRSARSAVFEVEARLGITRYAAEARVTTAEALEEFPAVADALAAGHIDLRKANVLLLEEGLSADERRVVHEKLLPDADLYTAPQLREMMRREALNANPAAARKRHAKAYADREVRIDPAPDSMACVTAYLRADDAETMRVVVDAMANGARAQGDSRTLPQLRADIFSDVFRWMADSGKDLAGQALPTVQRRRPHIQVTVAGGTLLGLDDQPAVLGGYGPIPADLARRIAQDGTWRALFTDAATGEFVALSSRAYRPGADLTRTIVARDVTCVFPGCRIPAWACEIDHIDSYDEALKEALAQTGTHECDAKCHGHHDVKTIGLWDSSRDPTTGEVTWTAPSGHRYVRRPTRPPGPPPRPAAAPITQHGRRPRAERDDGDDEPPPF
ncbi:HNH endonuclease signature motif containing protein [Georgenia sp. SUBG003]|uniref:HNH endonuclease signature motif containing protein n=1 Tax=Georgenia sp. SUBG003 TaxID=1497974 RepID=UPI0004D39502|nr:hypothetical protein DA06_08785 [Georgenia sp. SUBG003]